MTYGGPGFGPAEYVGPGRDERIDPVPSGFRRQIRLPVASSFRRQIRFPVASGFSRKIMLSSLIVILFGAPPDALAQARRPTPPKPRATLRTEPADVSCNATLGTGVRTGRTFCDVLAGREPSGGTIVRFPAHTGPLTLFFDLHNRHTYSAEQEKAGRAYTRYTATIGVLTMDNTLLSRAVIQSEFRKEADLFDRVAATGGVTGVKAVAPTGVESIALEIPAGIDQVCILGEKLATTRLDGEALYTAPGRPVAVISQVVVEYKPAPPAKKPVRRR